MTTVQDILTFMEGLAPYKLAESWDNVGLLCGRFDAPVELAKRYLPLFDLNLGWLLPAVIGFIIGMAIHLSKRSRAN